MNEVDRCNGDEGICCVCDAEVNRSVTGAVAAVAVPTEGSEIIDVLGNKPASLISTTTAIPFSSTISFHEVQTS